MPTTHTVIGMTCEHCVEAVRAEIEKLPGVTDVDVDLAAGTVTLDAAPAVSTDAVAAAVAAAGYTLAP